MVRGSSLPTRDIDIVPSRVPANLDRLARALIRMNAKIRIDGGSVPTRIDAAFLANMPFMLNLVTDFGEMDLTFTPAGQAGGYDGWRAGATLEAVSFVGRPRRLFLRAQPGNGKCIPGCNRGGGTCESGSSDRAIPRRIPIAVRSTACCNYIPHRRRCLSFPSYRDPTPSGHSSTSGFVVCGRKACRLTNLFKR